MRILIVGGGGREHAIAWKLKQSPRVSKLFCAPGNGGIAQIAQCMPVAATDIAGMTQLAKDEKIDLVIVTPDDPLALGMVDALQAQGIRAFGPTKAAARLEWSKSYAKDFMREALIPTAQYAVFNDYDAALGYVQKCACPMVVKADGLALGKGVLICETREQAKDALDKIMRARAFGGAGSSVVIEQFITGPEVSVLAFVSGNDVKYLPSSQDHKRALDGDQGLNTGGMGAFAPSPKFTPDIARTVDERIVRPTINTLLSRGTPFSGVLYFGLMLTDDGPMLLEYNARFGDPETQAVLPLIKTDLLDIFEAVVDNRLASQEVEFYPGSAVCVVASSGGYPGEYKTGLPISGLNEVSEDLATVFHAGTKRSGEEIITSGGRVLGVTAMAPTLSEAAAKAYAATKKIHFDGMHMRTDIGGK